MADHFAKEIFLLITAMSFLFVVLPTFSIDMIDKGFEPYEFEKDSTTFDNGWENTGNNYLSLENILPVEIFTTFIFPIIILVGYIVLKTASGILPNWLSGG